MLATARALMFEAKLLAIDEPSLGSRRASARSCSRPSASIHAEGVPVLLVEQEVAQVFRLADAQLRAVPGPDPRPGTAKSLMADETLRAGYLGL